MGGRCGGDTWVLLPPQPCQWASRQTSQSAPGLCDPEETFPQLATEHGTGQGLTIWAGPARAVVAAVSDYKVSDPLQPSGMSSARFIMLTEPVG